MHGMLIKGKTVAQVVAELKARGVAVAYFNYDAGPPKYNVNVRDLPPGTWYVVDAIPWAPHQVLLRLYKHPGTTEPGLNPTPNSH